ncbi:hypothetical protein ACMT1E_14110 [Sphingomonas flavalba]|uniref:hypothetical protein n=1 Tax=Sphingomonas flavalba TaxID=2559804 RepID=UPI0039E0B72B
MKQFPCVRYALAAALLVTAGHAQAQNDGDDDGADVAGVHIERSTPQTAVEGFAQTCLPGFPGRNAFAATMDKRRPAFTRVDGDRAEGHETWRSASAVIDYDYPMRGQRKAGAPSCRYSSISSTPVDHEAVSAMLQAMLDQQMGVSLKRYSGQGQYGWMWTHDSEETGYGDNTLVYLLYSYNPDPADRHMSLSLQVRRK